MLLPHETSRVHSSPLMTNELRRGRGRHLASLDCTHSRDRNVQELHLEQVSQMLLKIELLDDH